MEGYIYKHTNLANGRVYIGQTTQAVEKRWGIDGKNYKLNKSLYRDIIEYGWEGFSHEILEVVKARDYDNLKYKLDKTENYYIHKYKSMLSEHGYNTEVSSSDKRRRLSVSAKRYIGGLMKDGYSFDEAYEKYREKVPKKKRRKRTLRRGGK